MTREIIRRNLDIRSAAKSAGVFLYEIAEKIGVSEPTFNRKQDVWAVCPKGGTDAANKSKEALFAQGFAGRYESKGACGYRGNQAGTRKQAESGELTYKAERKKRGQGHGAFWNIIFRSAKIPLILFSTLPRTLSFSALLIYGL